MDAIKIIKEHGVVPVLGLKDPDTAPQVAAALRRGGLPLIEVTMRAEKAMDCGLTLLLEPLDRGAHKDNFIGPTPEAVAILREVHQSQPNVLLSWDSMWR